MRASTNVSSELFQERNLMQRIVRVVVVIGLMVAVAAEGYLISVLRDRIDKQTEDLRTISLQLQSLKNERDGLRDQMLSMKKPSGGEKDGDTDTR